MQLLSDYPWPFHLLCIGVGVAYAALLYWFSWRKQRQKYLLWASLLRFISMTMITFLLMAPLVKSNSNQEQKPIVVVAYDNSQSVARYSDATKQLEKVVEQMKKEYDVETLLYGQNTRAGESPDFNDRATNIDQLLTYCQENYSGRNIGALILTSDGIYNNGRNPISISAMPCAIYTIALGDTTRPCDAAITTLRYNRKAYVGNETPVQVGVRAYTLAGRNQQLSLWHGNQQIAAETLHHNSNNEYHTIDFSIHASHPGMQTYTLKLVALDGERTVTNNVKSFSIEADDDHQKIAILANAAHPDLGALKRAIETNPKYEVSIYVGDQWHKASVAWNKEYDLLITHNLPRHNYELPQAVMQMPSIMVIGAQSDLNMFNSLHMGIEVNTQLNKQSNATAAHNTTFQAFGFDQNIAQAIASLPPLSTPFGEYTTAANTATLFYASIGGITTEQPLITFSQRQGIRHALIMGEGLWRWRLYDHLNNGNSDKIDMLVNKMLTYTTLQVGDKRFDVQAQKIYSENEPVVLRADLYDDNYEITNQPEATITVGNKQYTFVRSGNSYSINLGLLDTGRYNYSALVKLNGQTYHAGGRFVVENLNLEGASMVANHTLLNTLAKRNNGEMLQPSEIKNIPQLLKQRTDLKSIIYSHSTFRELVSLPLVLILILLLLAGEWVMRKYNGEL